MIFRPVAQLAERRSPKPQVGGSIPSWPANYNEIMKNITNDTSNARNLLGTTAIILLTAGALYATYYLNFSSPVKAIIWIGWLVGVLLFGLLTSKGMQIYNFAKEAKIELQKVVWPSRQETVQTTFIVMIMVTITGFVLWGVDSGMMWIIGKITHLG